MNCKDRSIQPKIFVDIVLESERFILFSEHIFGYHCGTTQYEICIYNCYTKCEKTQKFSFFDFIYYHMVPRVVPKVLESKSMMFQLSKTVSIVINEYLDKILPIPEFC